VVVKNSEVLITYSVLVGIDQINGRF